MKPAKVVWTAMLTMIIASCATYREDLNRGQRLYAETEYERALAIWRYLEEDADTLSPGDQTRYAYLRGMTDYRLQHRADARHWLAIAQVREKMQPGALSEEWKQRLDEALEDLNREAFGLTSPEAATAVESSLAPTSSAQPPSGSSTP